MAGAKHVAIAALTPSSPTTSTGKHMAQSGLMMGGNMHSIHSLRVGYALCYLDTAYTAPACGGSGLGTERWPRDCHILFRRNVARVDRRSTGALHACHRVG